MFIRSILEYPREVPKEDYRALATVSVCPALVDVFHSNWKIYPAILRTVHIEGSKLTGWNTGRGREA